MNDQILPFLSAFDTLTGDASDGERAAYIRGLIKSGTITAREAAESIGIEPFCRVLFKASNLRATREWLIRQGHSATTIREAAADIRAGKATVRESPHTTDDFAYLLYNEVNKRAQADSQRLAPAWSRFVSNTASASNFLTRSVVSFGDFAKLETVDENGEYREVTALDTRGTYTLAKYGNIWSVSWEATLNDFLGKLQNRAAAFAQAGADALNRYVLYTLIVANSTTLEEGGELFVDSGDDATYYNSVESGGGEYWYLCLPPDRYETIEMAFLNGRQDVELWQEMPGTGASFTHDRYRQKARLVFGGGVINRRWIARSAATLTDANLNTLLQQLMVQKPIVGGNTTEDKTDAFAPLPVNLKLLVGKANWVTAKKLIRSAQTPGTANNDANVWSTQDELIGELVYNPYATTTTT